MKNIEKIYKKNIYIKNTVLTPKGAGVGVRGLAQ